MKTISHVYKGEFGKSIITLITGSLFAQILTILISPLLTRIFSPQELGIYTLILTAESLFGSIICGRYDVAIVSETDSEKVYPLIKICIIITCIFSTIVALVYGKIYFLDKSEYNSYSYAIIFIFFALLINGFIRVLESYNNRYKEYKVMTSVYILRTSVQNISAIVFGIFNLSVFGLLFSHTVGMLFGLKKQATTILAKINNVKKVSKKEMLDALKKHYRQPLYSVPAIFANRYSYSSINIFVESLFGVTVLGYYSISYKALGLPLTVMSNNVAKVFYQEASREYDKTGKYIKSFNKTSIFLIVLAIPMVLSMYYLAPPIFEIVFGRGWSESGVYVKILAPMFGVRFIVNTVAYGLQVARKQSLELILQIMFVLSSIGCFIISKVYILSIENYLRMITITFSIIYIIYYFIVWKYAYGNKVIEKG